MAAVSSVHLGVAGRVGVRVARRVPRLAAVEGGVEGQDGAGAVDERQAAAGRAADRGELPAGRDHARGRVDGESPHDAVRARRPRQECAGRGVERRQAGTAGATGLAEVAAGVDRDAVGRGHKGPHRLVGAGGEGGRCGAGGAIEPGHPGVGSAADGAELTAREERATGQQEAGHPAVRPGLEAGDEVGRAGRERPRRAGEPERPGPWLKAPPRKTVVPSKASASTGWSGLGFQAVTAPAAVTWAA